MSRIGRWLKPRFQDLAMRQMNDYRPPTVEQAHGDVLEVGFGTALNLRHYTGAVKSLTGVDPLEGLPPKVLQRIASAPFPVEHHALRADGALPFDAGRFDSVVFTWTLCSIPEPERALLEMRRVLKPEGELLFVEHGRSGNPRTARWQDRLNPLWVRLTDGCNLNRPVADVIRRGGFEVTRLEHFRGRGPAVVAEMYRGMARPAA
jgi:ubiquinone/menaquinone biosynthesis C-methylase UbiE